MDQDMSEAGLPLKQHLAFVEREAQATESCWNRINED